MLTTTIIAKLIPGLQINVCGGRKSKLSASQFFRWKEQDVIFDPTTSQGCTWYFQMFSNKLLHRAFPSLLWKLTLHAHSLHMVQFA